MSKKKSRPREVRRAVKAVLLYKNKKNGRYRFAPQAYWYQISTNTKLEVEGKPLSKFRGTKVPSSNIIMVKTNYGSKPAVVLENMEVTGVIPKRVIKKMRRVTRVTTQSLNDIAPRLWEALVKFDLLADRSDYVTLPKPKIQLKDSSKQ